MKLFTTTHSTKIFTAIFVTLSILLSLTSMFSYADEGRSLSGGDEESISYEENVNNMKVEKIEDTSTPTAPNVEMSEQEARKIAPEAFQPVPQQSNGISSFFGGIFSFFQNMFSGIASFFQNIFTGIGTFFSNLFGFGGSGGNNSNTTGTPWEGGYQGTVNDTYRAGEVNAGHGPNPVVGDISQLQYRSPLRNPSSVMDMPIEQAFNIQGSDTFKQRIIKALETIKTNSPAYYRMIASYNKGFVEDTKAGYHHNERQYHLTLPETVDPIWLQSIIVHDCWHSVQNLDKMFNNTVGDDVELNAIDIQADYLESIGESSAYVRSLDGTHWRK